MKGFFQFFKIPFICVGILLVIAVGCKIKANANKVTYVRTNTECTTEERVFDYGEVLTPEEEDELREKIAKAQQFCGCDIVIVTLNESLEEYAKSYEPIIGPVEPYQYTMVFADNFYDEKKFGFNKPMGDGVLLLDNWYRESDGHIYTWMSTTGKVYERYSSEMIDETLDEVYKYVEDDPAFAYGVFVDMIAGEMGPYNPDLRIFGGGISLILGLISGLIFWFVNRGSKKGKTTVTPTTYVEKSQPRMKVREDQFITRTVTRRRIETNSGSGSSGGGGGHISSSGTTHGGGGHSR